LETCLLLLGLVTLAILKFFAQYLPVVHSYLAEGVLAHILCRTHVKVCWGFYHHQLSIEGEFALLLELFRGGQGTTEAEETSCR
jgi:hypothetical protein